MSEQIEQRASRDQVIAIPAKCAECAFLDKEFDPWSRTTRLYCQAPWWHPKRWSCTLPAGVDKA